MKLAKRLVLPGLLGLAIAGSEPANVYIFPPLPQSLDKIQSLSTNEARLIIAQRLGVSQYHNLQDTAHGSIQKVATFGGQQSLLFEENAEEDCYQLVIMVEGTTSEMEKTMRTKWNQVKPAFMISEPPSETANKKFVEDVVQQSSKIPASKDCSFKETVKPTSQKCWPGKTNFVHFESDTVETMQEFIDIVTPAIKSSTDGVMDIMIIMMPASSRHSKSSANAYGTYDMPSHKHHVRSSTEELIEDDSPEAQNPASPVAQASTTSPFTAMKTMIPRCFNSLEACNSATRNCSSHGSCKKKYGNDQSACYSCMCIASVNVTDGNYKQSTYWGGNACQKEDISSQFWLITGFSVAAIGIVSWGIGMLFSIGEEKLPGVIGAGVSGPKTR